MRVIVLILLFFSLQNFYSQNFVNGDFEKTSAANDQINLSNDMLEKMLPGVYAFGSYGDVDIISSGTYGGGGPKNGRWYIALTGGGTDIVALELSQPLVKGQTYKMSFYDRKATGYPASPIQIGLSNEAHQFGEAIYIAPQAALENVWTQRVFAFTASTAATYITVQMPIGDISHWVNIDHFSFEPVKCPTELTLTASSLKVDKGYSVQLQAFGSGKFSWFSGHEQIKGDEQLIVVSPTQTTVYQVKSQLGDCPILTQTVQISVKEQLIEKKDSMIVIEKKDTLDESTEIQKYSRKKLNGRKLHIEQTITVNQPIVKILLWDKNKVDGDYVSVYLNGKLVLDSVEVVKAKKEITLHLQSGPNLLVMHAINLGKIPPNTAAIALKGDKKHKIFVVNSDLKKSGAVELIYDPEAVTLK